MKLTLLLLATLMLAECGPNPQPAPVATTALRKALIKQASLETKPRKPA